MDTGTVMWLAGLVTMVAALVYIFGGPAWMMVGVGATLTVQGLVIDLTGRERENR